MIKFYPVRYKRYPDRFNRTSNDGAVYTVIGTCLQIMSMHLRRQQASSLGFIATPSIIGNFLEDRSHNQRYRIYKQIMYNYFGDETFTHFADMSTSAYLMVNNKQRNIEEFVNEMRKGFSYMYPDLFNLQFVQL